MKKVGIITICDYQNYGNRLQNYATQEVLKSLGCEVETIVNKPNRAPEKGKISPGDILRKITSQPPSKLVKRAKDEIRALINRKKERETLARKIAAFRKFTIKNISETPFTITTEDTPPDLGSRYDYFITGSDQIWNPNFRYGTPADFLRFAPPEKRIAWAPSFGISDIPSQYTDLYTKWIDEIPHLSVREETGARIINSMTGKKAEVLVDPTLMLQPLKWLNLAKPAAEKPAKKYLLTYFLGELSGNTKRIINRTAKRKNLEVVHLKSFDQRFRYTSDPGEFLDYINSAEIIFTDSFHGTIFSVLFEKPFLTFNREGRSPAMSSRIDTLLSTLQLENRKWKPSQKSQSKHPESHGDIFDIKYDHVYPLIEAERNKTISFLKRAMKINGI